MLVTLTPARGYTMTLAGKTINLRVESEWNGLTCLVADDGQRMIVRMQDGQFSTMFSNIFANLGVVAADAAMVLAASPDLADDLKSSLAQSTPIDAPMVRAPACRVRHLSKPDSSGGMTPMWAKSICEYAREAAGKPTCEPRQGLLKCSRLLPSRCNNRRVWFTEIE